MKALAQTFLIGGGVLGLIPTLVAAIHRGLSGPFSASDIFILLSPLLCGLMIAIGLIWRRQTLRLEPRRSPGQLTEDPGGGF